MFGPSLMVVPVYEYKATTKSVYFPKGSNWYDFYNGNIYKGGENKVIDAPYERIPLFVPEGGILLFGPEINYVGEKKPIELDVFVYSGKDGSFYLYEDEGTNFNYEKGAFSKITFDYDDTNKTLAISNRDGSYPGMLENRTFNIIYVKPDNLCGWDTKKKLNTVVEYTGEKVTVKL